MTPRRDVYLALAAVIWSDGKVTPEEAEALVQAASAGGVTGADLDAVRESTASPGDVVSVSDLDLDGKEKLFVYGVASLLAGVDGTVTTDEHAMLGTLRELLGLSRDQLAAAIAAPEVRALAVRLRAARS